MPQTIRLAGLHVALVAMLLRALLPAGWMPNAAAEPATPFVICTVNGPVLAAIPDSAEKHKPGHDDSRSNDICPFAASIHLATPAAAATLAPSNLAVWIEPATLALYVAHDATPYAPQSPRAPPSFA